MRTRRPALGVLRQAVGDGARGVMLWRADDVTASIAEGSCLVVAPHPDDEVLGCGVTIMRKVDAGTPVHIVLVTDGRSSRHPPGLAPDEIAALRIAEARACADALGVGRDSLSVLGFPDGRLTADVDKLADRIGALIDDVGPSQVLAPSAMDPHPDHKAVSEATRAAAARSGREIEVLEYPVWLWTSFPWLGHARTRRPIDLVLDPGRILGTASLRVSTEGYVDRKRAAIAAYETRRHLGGAFFAHFLGKFETLFPASLGGGHVTNPN